MEIRKNSFVIMNYVGKFEDGTIFDSSEGREPLKFVFGVGMLVPGLEKGILGLKKGDKKKIVVEPKEGYGEIREDAFVEVSKEQLPEELSLEPGLELLAQTPMGPVPVRVKKVKDNSVIMDFNHPLAGKKLIFDVEILDVREATQEELESLKVNQ